MVLSCMGKNIFLFMPKDQFLSDAKECGEILTLVVKGKEIKGVQEVP